MPRINPRPICRPLPSLRVVFCERWHVKHLKRFASWGMLLAWFGWFIGMYFNTLAQVYVQKRSEHFKVIPDQFLMNATARRRVNTLPDLGFDLLWHVPASWVADSLVFGSMLATVVRFVPTPMGATILRRWLFILGTLFFLRGIAISVTMLPNPYHECNSTADEARPWLAGLMLILRKQETCADVLYSGHAVNLTLCALVWHYYSHDKQALLLDSDTEWDPFGELCCWARGKPLVRFLFGHLS